MEPTEDGRCCYSDTVEIDTGACWWPTANGAFFSSPRGSRNIQFGAVSRRIASASTSRGSFGEGNRALPPGRREAPPREDGELMKQGRRLGGPGPGTRRAGVLSALTQSSVTGVGWRPGIEAAPSGGVDKRYVTVVFPGCTALPLRVSPTLRGCGKSLSTYPVAVRVLGLGTSRKWLTPAGSKSPRSTAGTRSKPLGQVTVRLSGSTRT